LLRTNVIASRQSLPLRSVSSASSRILRNKVRAENEAARRSALRSLLNEVSEKGVCDAGSKPWRDMQWIVATPLELAASATSTIVSPVPISRTDSLDLRRSGLAQGSAV